ncbi:MAG TPA: ribonucleoside-diphosphate reductase subunit alpha, partial [Candidatus Omnitrophota bacterium]|nr:ribonucleoside-diphosphate reductase subunit alpha [Candidatus Omnitrophota bacterium]
MDLKTIIKRNGECVEFDAERIRTAIQKATEATRQQGDHGAEISLQVPESVLGLVLEELSVRYGDGVRLPTVENIQDVVERKLVESGFYEIARTYILYRAEHAQMRAQKRLEELAKLEKNLLRVKKRDGKQQVFDIRKIRKVFAYAVEGLQASCSFEQAYEVFKNTLSDGIETGQILKNLRRVCLDLITTENIHWQTVAARLYIMDLYKQACRNRQMLFDSIYTPQMFKTHFDDYIRRGLYYKKFYDYYTDDEVLEAGRHIDRKRDFSYIYSTVLSFDRRYLLNPNKEVRELPQEMYMAVALFLAIPEEKGRRLEIAKRIYDVTSTQKLSLPTPTLLNARTNYHQLSSCFKLNVADDLRSIYHNIENMAQISKFGGGVGVYLGHIRSRGAAIRGEIGASGGVIPWVRVINDTACAVNQLGARLGAISPTLDMWHRDINDYLNLQVETGDIRSKAFDVFPAVSVPDVFMKRVEANADWTLFDPHEVHQVTGKRMEDLFGEEFERFYEECERNDKLSFRESLKAKELMKKFLKTVVETGMPYVFFRDTVNAVNPNKHAGNIYSTQLCTEICQNTSESKFMEETFEDGTVHIKYSPGETVVCNLASINIARVFTRKDIDEVFPVAMRVLDNVITLNFYPIREAELTSKKYRSVGLGFMGLAEYLACHKLNYDSLEARERVDELFEQYAFAALRESNRLAEERGAYELFEGSEWQKGILFGRDEDWYRNESRMPNEWTALIQRIKKEGLRFSYHLAPAPNTSTSGVVGTTAGLLPV